ncbi:MULTISPECIES: hypothetical protein [Bradyrhizobium]|uniref:hypothetical protein n=1 Tax=Bradyrhizobium TaxID=374 RepID=UPI0004AFFE6E|nr:MULTISPECIES: hypothetical protein [Bradyrhizobium]MBR1030680.1 hypothetical protein [Bradyrhizobium liaoningense]MCP1774878.1 hypothetical protein [Bradyrhizobium japonicum]MCP1962121.1 hypothetical protein [Bradyrhizobium japonicum]MDI2074325.1 hypothetical protein [Bradyrhizobium sp. Mp27]
MGHTIGGGIGNCAGSQDHTRAEVIEELHRTGALDRDLMLKPLEWVATAKPGDDWPPVGHRALNSGWGPNAVLFLWG